MYLTCLLHILQVSLKMHLTKSLILVLVALAMTDAQKPKKTPVSNQDILSALNQQPVPSPGQSPPKNQQISATPELNVEPLPPKITSGADVMSSLQAACKALQSFISRSEYVRQQMTFMPPSLLPWLYAQKMGFQTECDYTSYSNALNVFVTACNIFESCPLPTPVMDLGTMMPSFAANFDMPLARGIGLPGVQRQLPVMLNLTPQAPNMVPQSLPAPKPGPQPVTDKQNILRPPVPAQRPQIPQRPRIQRKPQPMQVQTRVPVKPATVVQPVAKTAPKIKQPMEVQQVFPRMPIPSMASMYPLWVYGFRQMPTMGSSSGAKVSQRATTPRPGPEHDSSD